MSQQRSEPVSSDYDERETGATLKQQVELAMRRGDFPEVWKICDAALRRCAGMTYRHVARRAQWVWNGTPLANQRVLIYCNHGLGDTLHFIRYVSLVRAIASNVTVAAPPSLLPLLRSIEGIDLLPLDDDDPDCEYDVALDVMELAYLFRTTVDTIPAEVPYLHAAPAAIERDGRLAVGVVWRSGHWTTHRHVPFDLIESLADVPGVALFSLQRDPDQFSDRVTLLRGVNDPLATAQLMRAMDLVITIDSMPAHLAGALGVPTWTLLPADADWRWMEEREDSPWYPTMRLFRQQHAGEWEPVIERVRHALTTIATQSKSPTFDPRTAPLSTTRQLPTVDLEPALRRVATEVEGQLESHIAGLSIAVRQKILDAIRPVAFRQFKHAYHTKVLAGADSEITPRDHAQKLLEMTWREFIDGRSPMHDFIGIHTSLRAAYGLDACEGGDSIAMEALERYGLLRGIAASNAIELAETHISGVIDAASPRNNITAALRGEEAMRSAYGTAPGGSTPLARPMLNALFALTQPPYSYSFHVTEIAGGSHRLNSRHYDGAAFDVDRINGVEVSGTHPQQLRFRHACSALGASLVLGPPDQGHPLHIHAEWPPSS